jgi:37-kD nucleoid-associated bacterial protein
MILENLRVGRILIHEVFQRGDNRKPLTPAYAQGLETLSTEALGVFKERVTEALSAKAKSLEMQIAKWDEGSHLAHAEALLSADDKEFLLMSRGVADRLSDAQMARGVPGGMLIVFDGSAGSPSCQFLGVIKAEIQSGFRRRQDAKSIITEFLNNVFLTPATRLYKIGLMVQIDVLKHKPNGWKAFVFDNNISQGHREAAAQYFFEAFLGCALPADGAYETGRFFDLAKEFVRKSTMVQEEKRDVIDALITFVKTEKSKTFTSDEFGEKYLPMAMRDPFDKFLQARHFPDRAVIRDVSAMGSKLRRRRFRFGSDIEFTVSPEALDEEKATIVSGPAEKFGGKGVDTWTQITIRQPITDER